NIADINEGTVLVSVPNGFAKNWLQDKYHKPILRSLRNLADEVREVQYVVGPAEHSLASRPKPKIPMRSDFFDSQGDRWELKDTLVDPESGLNPRYTFDQFIV